MVVVFIGHGLLAATAKATVKDAPPNKEEEEGEHNPDDGGSVRVVAGGLRWVGAFEVGHRR